MFFVCAPILCSFVYILFLAYVICFVVVVVVVVVNLFASSGSVLLLLLHYGHSVVPFVCLNVLSKKKKKKLKKCFV